MVRKLIRLSVYLAMILLLVVGVLFWVLYQAARHEPEFYQAALRVEPERHAEAGDELEKRVLNLRNETRHEGHWEAVFTDQQINGWLAADLPEKFPQALPAGVSDPRVVLTPELAQLACRFENEQIATVVSVALDLRVADQPNVVAVHVRKLRAGAVPLPAVEQWKDRIEQAARRSGLVLKWQEADGDTVALVKIPQEHQQINGRRIFLETIRLREGAVYLAGRSESIDDSPSSPAVFHTAIESSENSAIQR